MANMKTLFIGGTGNISSAVSRLAVSKGIHLDHLNRGKSESTVDGVGRIVADIGDRSAVEAALGSNTYDVVVNWIAFTPEDMERDVALFRERTRQYIFISSASVYQKPPTYPIVTESTPLKNPYWEYSRQKIACEEYLNKAYRDFDFPMTIVRPSLTYDTVIPAAIGGWRDYTLIDRIKHNRPIVVHGDGGSLWTITHADDFARGFVGLLDNPRAIGHAFHITSDEILTWNQIYQCMGNAVGVDPLLVHIPTEFIVTFDANMRGGLLGDKAVSAIFDNSKIKSFVPEFQATIPFREGIRRTIAWFEQDPSRTVVSASSNAFFDTLIAAYKAGQPDRVS